jgi:hypothetical protein
VNSDPNTATDTSERLKITIEELSGIQTLLGSGELDPRILADFRDALAENGFHQDVPRSFEAKLDQAKAF